LCELANQQVQRASLSVPLLSLLPERSACFSSSSEQASRHEETGSRRQSACSDKFDIQILLPEQPSDIAYLSILSYLAPRSERVTGEVAEQNFRECWISSRSREGSFLVDRELVACDRYLVPRNRVSR